MYYLGIQGLFKISSQIQGLFNTVRTLFTFQLQIEKFRCSQLLRRPCQSNSSIVARAKVPRIHCTCKGSQRRQEIEKNRESIVISSLTSCDRIFRSR